MKTRSLTEIILISEETDTLNAAANILQEVVNIMESTENCLSIDVKTIDVSYVSGEIEEALELVRHIANMQLVTDIEDLLEEDDEY